MSGRRLSMLLGSAILAALIGCGPANKQAANGGGGTPANGEEHQHPETLDGMVTELAEMRDTIRDSFAADKPEDAHDLLHDVGHLLELIEEKSVDLPAEKQVAVTESVDKLFQLFDDVDAKMHNEEGAPDYADVSDDVDAAIESLFAAISEGDSPGEPKADAPKADEPKADEPKADEPKAGEPKAGEPKADEPKADAPKADAPKADEPKADEPKADEPKADEPKADEPKADAPKADEPKADEPKADEPKADEPKADEPKADEPKADEPKADEPKADEPKADEPKADEPKADEPKADEPE